MGLRKNDWLALGVLVALFHLTGVALINDFYFDRISHYDSVGGYMQAFSTILVQREHGYLAGLAAAWEKGPQSITQNMFAGLFAPFLTLSQESMHLYNTIAVGIALSSVAYFVRVSGGSFAAAMLAAVLFFVPDCLYWWDLGLFDYRRDTGLFSLLTATFFIGIAYVTATLDLRQRAIIGLTLGVVAGLTLICRDTAFAFLGGVALAPIGVTWIAAMVLRVGGRQWDRPIWALAGMAPFLVIFLLRMPDVLNRIADPLTMYGMDRSGGTTFGANAHILLDAATGQFQYPFNSTPWITPWLLVGVVVALACTVAARLRSGVRSGAQEGGPLRLAALVGSAIWIPLFVHFFLAMIVHWRSGQPPIVAMAPYMPAMIALHAALVALILYGRGAFARRWGAALAGVLAALVMLSVPARALSRQAEYPPGVVAMHRALALASGTGGTKFAEVTSEGLRLPAVQLIALQVGNTPPERVRITALGRGALDFNIGAPDSEADREALLAAMDHAIRCDADYIIAFEDPAGYGQDDSPIFVLKYGREMMTRVLSDLANAPRESAGSGGVVIIDNRLRTACEA